MSKNKEIILPDYSLKISRKARNVWLKISDEKGLVVVIPKWYNRKNIPELLRKEKKWITRTIKRLEEQKLTKPTPPPFLLPPHIYLKALGEFWKIKYQKTPAQNINLSHCYNSTLTLSGDIDNVEKCRDALRIWLAMKAKMQMVPWLKQLANKNNLSFKKILIKGQKTIWGSCSPNKTISINYKLLLIPRKLVRYVLIHELCHTVHLNHSPQFWRLVAKKEPNYKGYDTQLRPAWHSMPSWIHK